MILNKTIFVLLLFTVINVHANNYTLTITDANHHLAEVEVVFTGVATKAFNVKLPVWRPGKYEILDLTSNIRNFQAYDASNKPLTWHKTDKNTWKIFVNTTNIVKVTYQIYANRLSDRVSHIDATHAYLDASGVFMYSESSRDKPLTVKVNVPENWRSVSGMQAMGEHEFKADNYDQLVDSPIETGINHFDTIKVEEQTYEIVIWGDGNFDMQQLKNDIEKLHYQAKDIWQTFPFKRYVYMYHLGNNLRGATEHVNSTIIQTDRFGFFPGKKYRKVIGTTAHEFIHTWNVKSYRPAGISPYDYSNENYSDLFWMAEGKTSFYDNVFNVRAGIYTVNQYLEYLAEDIAKFTNKPGRHVMSLKQSSFDKWLENDTNRTHNSTVSIYLKGSLVSWLLDKEIRTLTDNKKSLDDLSRLLYQRYANAKHGYTSYNVRQLLQEITSNDFVQFWSDYVDGTQEIDFTELLKFYGLKINKIKSKSENNLSLGIQTKQNNGLTEILTVDRNRAAWNAGLSAGDTLVAINGYQVNDNLAKLVENLELNKSYIINYFNNGILKQANITADAAVAKIEIVPIKSPTKQQKAHFKGLTKQKWQPKFVDDN
ncbi:MAG: M61 family peptidase [Proteobacteria bacterium]|nr:M61 family peptidase [Pseudomonadota bacterium]